MNDELVDCTAKMFDDCEKWNSFIELSNMRDSIASRWMRKMSRLVRDHFLRKQDPNWTCIPWGNHNSDSRWYLNYFKSDSLSITFAWNCQLVLYLENQTRFNSNLITQELQNPEFTPISLAFDRIDRRYEPQCKLLECRNFQFDSPSDGDVSEHMLPWYAGNKTKEFADQIIKKVERFTQNDEVTKLIYKLNEIALIKPDQ